MKRDEKEVLREKLIDLEHAVTRASIVANMMDGSEGKLLVTQIMMMETLLEQLRRDVGQMIGDLK